MRRKLYFPVFILIITSLMSCECDNNCPCFYPSSVPVQYGITPPAGFYFDMWVDSFYWVMLDTSWTALDTVSVGFPPTRHNYVSHNLSPGHLFGVPDLENYNFIFLNTALPFADTFTDFNAQYITHSCRCKREEYDCDEYKYLGFSYNGEAFDTTDFPVFITLD